PQVGGLHPALAIDGDALQLTGTEADQSQRADNGDVHFVADDHGKFRSVLQAVALDVPSDAAKHLVARRRERGEVRGVAARDKPDARGAWQPEKIEDPLG